MTQRKLWQFDADNTTDLSLMLQALDAVPKDFEYKTEVLIINSKAIHRVTWWRRVDVSV